MAKLLSPQGDARPQKVSPAGDTLLLISEIQARALAKVKNRSYLMRGTSIIIWFQLAETPPETV